MPPDTTVPKRERTPNVAVAAAVVVVVREQG